MLGAVRFHDLLHPIGELALVFGEFHINEVYHDDATQVAQAQLTGDLISSFQVGLECILFLVVANALVSAVHIDHMQSFGVLDDQVGAAVQVDGLSERRFHLFGDAVCVKNMCG